MADFGSLGQDGTQFSLNEVDIYLRDGSTNNDWKLIGYTDADKTVKFNQEFAEFLYGIPQITAKKKMTKESLTVEFNLKQFDAKFLSYLFNGTYSTGAFGERIDIGTSKPTKPTYAMKFVTYRDDGVAIVLTTPKTQLDINGDMPIGSVSDFAGIPVVATALHDSTRGATKNEFVWEFLSASQSVTGTTI